MDELRRNYKPCEYRNSGEAFRRFHSSSPFTSVREIIAATMRHRWTGGIIALLGAAGLIGLLITFRP